MSAIDLNTRRLHADDAAWDALRDARQAELDRRRAIYIATYPVPSIMFPEADEL